MSIVTDGLCSDKWRPFAKQKLQMLKDLGLPAKTYTVDGYRISLTTMDGIARASIAEPVRALASWGINDFPTGPGVLGTGDTVGRSAPGPVLHRPAWVAVSAGRSHALGINSDSTLWAWGDNSNGSLGVGDTTDRLKPSIVGGGWAAVSAGHYFSIGIKIDGTLWAWGGNYVGDPPINSYTPVQVGSARWEVISAAIDDSFGIQEDGTLWDLKIGLGVVINAASPSLVDGGQWRSVSASDGHRLAIKADGSLWAWGRVARGSVSHGALGLGDTEERLVPTQVGDVWAAAQAVGSHSLGIKPDGSLWAWGYNIYQQLGLGDSTDRLSPSFVDAGPWIAISGGQYQSTGIKADGSLWQWGNGYAVPTQVGSDTTWRIVSTGYAAYSLGVFGWAGRPDCALLKRIQGVV